MSCAVSVQRLKAAENALALFVWRRKNIAWQTDEPVSKHKPTAKEATAVEANRHLLGPAMTYADSTRCAQQVSLSIYVSTVWQAIR